MNKEVELKAVPTRVLLKKLDRARASRCSLLEYEWDFISHECPSDTGQAIDELEIEINELKAVLATREHIPSKREAKLIRKWRARHKH